MVTKDAVQQLAALAQETRLEVFRLLVQAGPDGLPAGAIAEQVGVPPSTLSFHLKELDHAGLVRFWRVQRQIFYAAEYERMRELLTHLTEHCCGGRPEICGGLVALATACTPKAAVPA